MMGSQSERDEDRKLFIGGLSWETTQDDLKEYFKKFGEVTEVNVKTDLNTGRSRGFAFLQFANKESVDQVLSTGPHNVNNKQVDPKRAKPRPGCKKIFVGGIDPALAEEDIKSYFEQFGKIEELVIPFDKQKNQRRQFCFITFEKEESVEEVCKKPKQKIGSKECDIKKATPMQSQRSRGGFGSGFRGRGGYPGWGNHYCYDFNHGYDSYGGYGGYDGYGYGYAEGYNNWGNGDGGSYGGQRQNYGKSSQGNGNHTFLPYSR